MVDLQLNIDENFTKCFLVINHKLSYDKKMIFDALAQKEIVIGINKDIIAKFIKDGAGDNKELLIADVKTNKGKNGYIKDLIAERKEKDPKAILYVKKNESIIFITPPEDGEDSTNLKGEMLKSQKGDDFDISKITGQGLFFDAERSCLASSVNGLYEKSEDGKISIKEQNLVNLMIEKDNSKCYLIIDDYSLNTFTNEELKNALQNAKITIGIKEEVIKNLTESKMFDEKKILIAESTAPTKGEDGFVEYFIKKLDETIGEDENKDFYNTGSIITVRKGEALAKIVPPTAGIDGIDVLGGIIKAKAGQEYESKKVLGKGVVLDKTGFLINAEIDGIYEHNFSGSISVVDEFRVKSDVDYEVGNIDTTSALDIGGDVKAGFYLKSDSNIVVNGTIENAEIICGNDLICKQGIIAGDKKIFVKGELLVKYITERECEAKSFFVENGIRNSFIKAIDSIEAKVIVGGETYAKNNLVVDELGSSQYLETMVVLGQNFKVVKKIEENMSQISELKKELKLNEIKLYRDNQDYSTILKKIDTFLDNKSTNKNILNSLSMQSKILLKQITVRKSKITNSFELKIKAIENINIKLKEKLNEATKSELIIKKTVYPNVKIRIKQSKIYEVKNELNNVKFALNKEGDEVIVIENHTP